jgi:hypothetical protein
MARRRRSKRAPQRELVEARALVKVVLVEVLVEVEKARELVEGQGARLLLNLQRPAPLQARSSLKGERMRSGEFVETLTVEQRDELAKLLAGGASVVVELVDELAKAAKQEAEIAKLPRRGTNHTHPAKPGQPCPKCGV